MYIYLDQDYKRKSVLCCNKYHKSPSQWTCGLRRESEAALFCWNRGFESRRGAWIPVSRECHVLRSIGLCVGLINPPEESHTTVVCLIAIWKTRRGGGQGTLGAVQP